MGLHIVYHTIATAAMKIINNTLRKAGAYPWCGDHNLSPLTPGEYAGAAALIYQLLIDQKTKKPIPYRDLFSMIPASMTHTCDQLHDIYGFEEYHITSIPTARNIKNGNSICTITEFFDPQATREQISNTNEDGSVLKNFKTVMYDIHCPKLSVAETVASVFLFDLLSFGPDHYRYIFEQTVANAKKIEIYLKSLMPETLSFVSGNGGDRAVIAALIINNHILSGVFSTQAIANDRLVTGVGLTTSENTFTSHIANLDEDNRRMVATSINDLARRKFDLYLKTIPEVNPEWWNTGFYHAIAKAQCIDFVESFYCGDTIEERCDFLFESWDKLTKEGQFQYLSIVILLHKEIYEQEEKSKTLDGFKQNLKMKFENEN